MAREARADLRVIDAEDLPLDLPAREPVLGGEATTMASSLA